MLPLSSKCQQYTRIFISNMLRLLLNKRVFNVYKFISAFILTLLNIKLLQLIKWLRYRC